MDIDSWLHSIGLDRYAQIFRENAVDLSVVPYLTDEDLEKLGVLLGHRRKFLRAAAELGAVDKSASPVALTATAPPRKHDAAERRQLTIMFCDLVGSTALSTRLDPEDLREVIGAYQSCCADIITGAKGFVARYMGDGVLAYFGYPQAHEHDAERAVRAGLTLVEAVPKLASPVGDSLQVRVGIATGLVVVGDLISAGLAEEQAVIGETPNLAARLQAIAEPGTVVISSSTRRLTGGLFDYRELGTFPLKGFDEPVKVWRALGVSAAESRYEALRASALPLVNRYEEIDQLMQRWDGVQHGEGSVVLLSGEAGIGKSRIAQTVLERLSSEPHTVVRQFCSPYHQDTALYPVIAQLERTAGFRRDDKDEQRLAKLEASLVTPAGGRAETMSLFAGLLSIPDGGRYPALDLTPQKRKERTLQALLAQLEGLATRQPLLFLMEDMHWADSTSLELFGQIMDRAPALPLLAIATFRPDFVPPWAGRPQVTMIGLDRLQRRHCTEMIVHLTARKVLPQEIADQITERTDGVPLFVEELTKAVVESGVLVEQDDRYVAAGPVTQVAIPTSLQESLLARLDRLAPTSNVAQIAAALGRQFSHELISAVAGMPPAPLNETLQQLVNAELIFRRGTPPDAEYTFKHALVQDTAYGTMLRSTRHQVHGRIAAALEAQFPDICATQPAVLARHCTEAGLTDKAVSYWLKAGQQALARSATIEAATQLRKGLDALKGLQDTPERRKQELDLQLALALAQMAMKGYSAPEVGETLGRARVLAERIDQPRYLWPVILGQSSFHRVRGEHRRALELAEQLERVGEARNDVAAQLVGRWANGRTRLFLGEFVAARELLERCHGLADPAHRSGVSSADPYVMTLAYLAWTLAVLGHLDEARTRLNEALSEARRLNHTQTLADALLSACPVERIIGSPNLQQHEEELLALSTERGFPLHLGWATAYRGVSLTLLGQPQEGLSLIHQAMTTIRTTGAVTGTPDLLMMLADAYAKLERPAEGLSCLAEAKQVIEATDERYGEAELYRLRGTLLNATGDPVAAEQNYRQAITVAQLQSAKPFELRTSIGLARILREQGRHAEAHDLLASIYGWFAGGLDAPDLKEAKALLDMRAS
ncbi:AAA family ATPase [Bradyrhizobium sp. ISRA443]|uniref:adenylate/guanylate cyclase domain-containing protein n=1 Tax=unclassified Bradyrhizobium TaxID=2631580 RepID=UPI002478DE46|nr:MULTISPECIES: adenylate/guanylate cyclase domain-containing protein [unclassified Bradyrhizobium]WGS01772.1 AAA family ATPase [Bradyrhizobium sp. ISRA436]WGS08658.1 AAA family ATPase [Bradyrhizobium sp. ISRA437]WGS15546.1 AAA family ATPase [Bradyrhizobium sp. ISRA443]